MSETDRKLLLIQREQCIEIEVVPQCEQELLDLLDAAKIQRGHTNKELKDDFLVPVFNISPNDLSSVLKDWDGGHGWLEASKAYYGTFDAEMKFTGETMSGVRECEKPKD